MNAAWPLVHRAPQLRRIGETVRRADRRAMVITGPAGTGKTRLAFESLTDLRRHRLPTHWLVATHAATSLPLAAVAHLFPDARASDAPVELLAQARRALRRQGDGRRVIVGVDDAHLLDDASATLIGHLAAAGTAFVLCTVRAGEPVPGPIRAFLDTAEGESLVLADLSRDGVAEVLTQALGGQVDTAATHRLHRLSDGNPLLLRELYDDADGRSAFRRVGSLWRLDDEWSPPERLPDLVGTRVSALRGDLLAAAQALALAEPLEVSVFEEAFGAAVASLDDERLLDVVPDQRRALVRLIHPLYAEVLRGGTTPLRARSLHRRLAEALRHTGVRRRGDGLRLASWWLAAGAPGDATTLLSAARQAHAAFDHALAERLARAALQSGGGLGAVLALADALRWQGRAAEAEAVLADYTAGSDPEPAAAIALIGLYGSTTADSTGVDELLDKAEALVTDPVALDQITALRADIAVGRWRLEEAVRLVRPLLERPGADPDQVVLISETAAAAYLLNGRTGDAIDAVKTALDLIEQGQAESTSVLAGPLLAERAAATLFAGKLEQGRTFAFDAYTDALDRGLSAPRAWYGMLVGLAHHLGGAGADALRWIREANELMREHPGAQGRHIRVWGFGLLAEAAAMQGELDTARHALEQADELLDQAVGVIPRDLGRAWTAAAADDRATACALLREAATTAAGLGAYLHEALAWHDLVRLSPGEQDAALAAGRLAELVELTDGALVPALAAHARAAASRDPAALDAAARLLSQLGLFGRAAEAAAQAASVWGSGPRARAASAVAHGLAQRTPGPAGPALRLDPASAGLTERERQVADLAAAGRSSRDIAAMLVISVRTVDNHLHRVYHKLGITSREELSGHPAFL